jgi:hypothetical protein
MKSATENAKYCFGCNFWVRAHNSTFVILQKRYAIVKYDCLHFESRSPPPQENLLHRFFFLAIPMHTSFGQVPHYYGFTQTSINQTPLKGKEANVQSSYFRRRRLNCTCYTGSNGRIIVTGIQEMEPVSPLGTSATTGLLYQPRMVDDECGAVGGMRIGRGNQSTGRKLAPVPLSPPQIPHDVTWARKRAAAVGSRRLTAWAMTRPVYSKLVTQNFLDRLRKKTKSHSNDSRFPAQELNPNYPSEWNYK